MASFGYALLIASRVAHAMATGMFTFESYADADCSASALTTTDHLKSVPGSDECYVYTDENGVAIGASSFSLACSDRSGDYTEYSSLDCTAGSAVPSGTELWFATTMCASYPYLPYLRQGTVFTDYASPSSCTKSYLPKA